MLLVSSANAQTFVASFGVEHTWNVPRSVTYYIDDYYYDYDWVHARRYMHHGFVNYEVVLQRGPFFIEIAFDGYGQVIRRIRRDYYPLANHVCSSFCGYHANYYRVNYRTCHSHNHHGHNHVAYYNRPRGNAYGYYKNGNHNHRNQSRHYDHRDDRRRYDYGNSNSRRDTYYDHSRNQNNGRSETRDYGNRGNYNQKSNGNKGNNNSVRSGRSGNSNSRSNGSGSNSRNAQSPNPRTRVASR